MPVTLFDCSTRPAGPPRKEWTDPGGEPWQPSLDLRMDQIVTLEGWSRVLRKQQADLDDVFSKVNSLMQGQLSERIVVGDSCLTATSGS